MSNRLRVLRAERKWTQAEVARRLRVSRQAINAVENGKYDPGVSLALALAKLFQVPVEHIFSLEAEHESAQAGSSKPSTAARPRAVAGPASTERALPSAR